MPSLSASFTISSLLTADWLAAIDVGTEVGAFVLKLSDRLGLKDGVVVSDGMLLASSDDGGRVGVAVTAVGADEGLLDGVSVVRGIGGKGALGDGVSFTGVCMPIAGSCVVGLAVAASVAGSGVPVVGMSGVVLSVGELEGDSV